MNFIEKNLAHVNVHKAFSIFFLLLITSGIGNVIFSGTFLTGWKQIILIIGYVICFSLVKKYHDFLRQIFVVTIFIQVVLVFASIISGMTVDVVFYNLFYYSAWVPFFIWTARGGADFYLVRYGKLTLNLVIACGIGLLIDSQTDIFLFLASRQEELNTDYFLQHPEVVKRSAFIFTTATLVMPVLGGMIAVSLLNNQSVVRILVAVVVILIAITTSASANATLIGGGLIFGMLMNVLMLKKGSIIRILFVVLALFIAASFFNRILEGDGFISKQASQILEHQSIESDGNQGRLWHWYRAFIDIQDFTIIEHVFGSGLGTTNGNNGNQNVLHTHGESSFLQAYLEGGMLGLTLRVLPFLLIVIFAKRNNSEKRFFIIYGYIVAVFLTDAVAPIFGNIPSQVLLGFLMGYLYLSKRVFSLQNKGRVA